MEESMSRPTLRPAVFLDRDGTLIHEKEYLADPDRVVLIPGALEALRILRKAGFALGVVTNQSGIARGLYRLDQYQAVAARMEELLREAGLAVDATEFCPHHPDFGPRCECRKPGTGMYRAAAQALGLDLSRSYFVGDRTKDVLPARALRGTGILVRTGYGSAEEEGLDPEFAVTDDVLGAALWILTREAELERQGAPGVTLE